ncbi:MAG: ATP-binding protein [Nitrospirota bacterium]
MIIRSFRLRLTLIYTAAVLFMFSLFAGIIYVKNRSDVLDGVDQELMKEVQTELLPYATRHVAGPNRELIKFDGDEYYQIINSDGNIIISNLKERNYHWPLNERLMRLAFDGSHHYDTVLHRGERFRILYHPVDKKYILRVGLSLTHEENEANHLLQLYMVFFPAVMVVTAAMSWFLAGRALSPVVTITSLAERIIKGAEGERINIGVKGREIDDLVRLFNTMLETLQHNLDAQRRFTSNVSHELRSPLTSLRGTIEVALRKKRPPEEYEDLLRSTLADTVRLSRIIDSLLFLSRADNNILEFRRQWLDVSQLLSSIVDRYRERAAAGNLSIIENYGEHLEINADSDMLEQAFANLIENALKYTPPGGAITISTERENSGVKVTVSDTGAGIPEAAIPHIFERFYRVDRDRSRKQGGTGLGLAITQWIVSAHRGSISVKSREGEGSDFIVILPEGA